MTLRGSVVPSGALVQRIVHWVTLYLLETTYRLLKYQSVPGDVCYLLYYRELLEMLDHNIWPLGS